MIASTGLCSHATALKVGFEAIGSARGAKDPRGWSDDRRLLCRLPGVSIPMSVNRTGCLVAVVVVAAAMFTAALYLYFFTYPKLKDLAASNLAFELDRRIEAFHLEFREWPKGDETDILLQLQGDNPGNLVFVTPDFPIERNRIVDAWGNPVFFQPDAEGRPWAISPGRSGKPGTKDDIDRTVAAEKAHTVFPDGTPPFTPIPAENVPRVDGPATTTP